MFSFSGSTVGRYGLGRSHRDRSLERGFLAEYVILIDFAVHDTSFSKGNVKKSE